MYGHPLEITESVKFQGVQIDNHLSMTQLIEHIEMASHISRMRIAKLNSVNATLLTLFRMGIFRAAHGWGGKKSPRKSVTHILQ